MKSCIDCSHLKAKIPLLHTSNAIVMAKLLYKKAIVTCEEGLLKTYETRKDRKFKKVEKRLPI